MRTSSIKNWLVRPVAYCTIGLIIYMTICLLLLIFSALLLQQKIFFSDGILKTYQKTYYWGGAIRIWQLDSQCVVLDSDLIYKPKLGECNFENPEFKTTLNFDAKGRLSAHKFNGNGIAVIGDSFAMGWGVGDGETFSAILEQMVKRPIYNLAVSSYGTYRELLRLEKSGLLDQIDTVIIQYCHNDLAENEQISEYSTARAKSARTFASVLRHGGTLPLSLTTIKTWLAGSLAAPVRGVIGSFSVGAETGHPSMMDFLSDDHAAYRDFSRHCAAMNRVFAKFPWITTKKVIITYTNGPNEYFRNFEEAGERCSAISATFVELNSEQKDFYIIDVHWNKLGHHDVARKLAPFVM